MSAQLIWVSRSMAKNGACCSYKFKSGSNRRHGIRINNISEIIFFKLGIVRLRPASFSRLYDKGAFSPVVVYRIS